MNYLPSQLARIFQLATHFELQNPDLRPEDCAKHITEVDHPKEIRLSNHTIAASAIQSLQDDSHYYITIEHQYRERDHWYTSARLDGELIHGTHTDATIAIGVVKISPLIIRRVIGFVLFGFGAMWLFSSVPTANILAWLFPLICFGIAGYYFWTGLSDRNSLLSAIKYLMTDAHSFSAQNKHENPDQMIEMTFHNKVL